jgi:hypothetical protein
MAFHKATEFFKNVKDTIQNKSETEKLLDDALSKQAHFASGTLLQDIARLTFDYMEYPVVMKAVWDGLNHAGKNWRQILKVYSPRSGFQEIPHHTLHFRRRCNYWMRL